MSFSTVDRGLKPKTRSRRSTKRTQQRTLPRSLSAVEEVGVWAAESGVELRPPPLSPRPSQEELGERNDDEIQSPAVFGAVLLSEEIDRQIATHARELRHATESLETVACARFRHQAQAAAAAAAADIAADLRRQKDALEEEKREFARVRELKMMEIQLLRETYQHEQKQERQAAEERLKEELASMKALLMSEHQKIEATKSALRREWKYVDLSSEVAEVFLKQTSETKHISGHAGRQLRIAQRAICMLVSSFGVYLFRAAAAAEAENEARQITGAARTKLQLATDTERAFREQYKSTTESALFLHQQATEAKRQAEEEKAAWAERVRQNLLVQS